MRATNTEISDVMLIEPNLFEDDRGHFFESFNERKFSDVTDAKVSFVQDNQSRSRRGVVRGLHFQLSPRAQGKLIRVISGEIFDVAVDLRKDSASFGQWIGEVLSSENRRQLWIPVGFAHGFVALSDVAEVLYKATDYYSPEHERAIRWDDEEIGIKWPRGISQILSAKDAVAPRFHEYLAEQDSTSKV